MDDNTQLYDLIPLYVRGELKGNDLTSFEKALTQDAALKEEVLLEKASFDLLLDADVLNLKAQMQNDLKAKDKAKNKKWIVALGVLAIGSGTYFLVPNASTDVAQPEPSLEVIALDTMAISPKQPAITEPSRKIENKNTATAATPNAVVNTKPTVLDTLEIATPQKVSSIDTAKVVHVPADTSVAHVKLEVQKTPKPVVTDPCAEFAFAHSPQTLASLRDAATGVILLHASLTQSGQDPIRYSLNGIEFENTSSFENLEAGMYTLYARDEQACEIESTKQLEIIETRCFEEYQQTFNTAFESSWKLPVYIDTPVKITLINKVGAILVDKDFQTYDEGSWNGFDDNNNKLPSGAYRWIMEYESGETCIAKMTILN